jgi:hypothetical protein
MTNFQEKHLMEAVVPHYLFAATVQFECWLYLVEKTPFTQTRLSEWLRPDYVQPNLRSKACSVPAENTARAKMTFLTSQPLLRSLIDVAIRDQSCFCQATDGTPLYMILLKPQERHQCLRNIVSQVGQLAVSSEVYESGGNVILHSFAHDQLSRRSFLALDRRMDMMEVALAREFQDWIFREGVHMVLEFVFGSNIAKDAKN